MTTPDYKERRLAEFDEQFVWCEQCCHLEYVDKIDKRVHTRHFVAPGDIKAFIAKSIDEAREQGKNNTIETIDQSIDEAINKKTSMLQAVLITITKLKVQSK